MVNKKRGYLLIAIFLLVCSLYLGVGSILINRMEFYMFSMVGAVGSGESFKRYFRLRKSKLRGKKE